MMFRHLIGACLLGGFISLLPIQDSFADVTSAQFSRRDLLPFRAMIVIYGDPRVDNSNFWKNDFWDSYLGELSREGWNAIYWRGPNELWGGDHVLTRLENFPEARELAPEQNEAIIKQMQGLLQRATSFGMRNLLYTQVIFYTKSFAKAHSLEDPMPSSPTVSTYHNNKNYAEHANCGVRNELTRAYTEAVYGELLSIYKDLDGFNAPLGEPLPGDRSTFFAEAIVPALIGSGRNPLIIVHQWQIPLENYIKNITLPAIYDNTWLGFHAYNSEQITDTKPYPGLIEWVEKTSMPTVVDINSTNILNFPFNSPKLAYEITREMKKINGLIGFTYWESHNPPDLTILFRKGLARYAKSSESYSEDVWMTMLEEHYGNREAARYFLAAYDLSARIIPELCALVYQGGNAQRRELRLPYYFLTPNNVAAWMTSPARGRKLVPVPYYARIVAKQPGKKGCDGGDITQPPYCQQAFWGSEGGSVFDIVPRAHMEKVRSLAEQCLRQAEQGLEAAWNKNEAEVTYNWMKAYQLLARYYERKVGAATAALIYSYSHRPADKIEAERLADAAVESYVEAADFMHEKVDPLMKALRGRPLQEAGVGIPELIGIEKEERQHVGQIFDWPE